MAEKILYLCGGRGFHAKSLGRKIAGVAESWRAKGHEVTHLCGGDLSKRAGGADATQPAMSQQEYYGKWYRRTGMLNPLVRTVAEWRDLQHDKQFLKYIESQAATFRPDLIWERPSILHTSGVRLARELNIPYVVEWLDHLVQPYPSLFRRRTIAWEKSLYRNADFVVVVSEVLRSQLAAEGVDRNKIIVAFNAVDPEEFHRDLSQRAEGRRRLGIADDEVLAGYIGSYAFYHDSARLVLAADLLRRRGGPKLRILMLGDGLEYPECRALAEKLGLLESGMVLMKPRIPKEEVPGVLAAMDIAVLPGSTDIICPIKIQEYMAAELPSVLPDYPANREVVVQGKTGRLFRPMDEESLAESLAGLAADASLRVRMGEAARKEVTERFTWDKTWGAALDEILHKVGAATPTSSLRP